MVFLLDTVYEAAITATRRNERKRIIELLRTRRDELKQQYFAGQGLTDHSEPLTEFLTQLEAPEDPDRYNIEAVRARCLCDIRERRAKADADAMKLRFPDENAARWADVDVLLELLGIQFSDPIVK